MQLRASFDPFLHLTLRGGFLPPWMRRGNMADKKHAVPDTLPILPVRDTVLFPGAVLPLTVGRESSFVFVFNDTATTEIYTLSLHDALPTFELGLESLR